MEEITRFQRERDELGDWGDAFVFSRGAIRVSLDELAAFFEEYIALLMRYSRRDADPAPDARVVLTRFFAVPGASAPAGEEDRTSEQRDRSR